jgi:capsid assembly protease
MRLPQILAQLTEEPMLITPTAHAALLKLFEDHTTLERVQFRAQREGVDWCGDAVEVEQAGLVDGIFYIPIGGPIGRGLGKFEVGAGCVDVGDVMDELDQFESDPNARAAILDIDSPGGMFSGTPELANRIMACNKPTAAFMNLGCSAAFWLAIACDYAFAAPSGDVGSIGVYSYFLDRSKQFEQAGIKPVLVSSGPYKGAGAPGVPLTKVQLQQMQDRVNEMAEMFYQHVEARRPEARREDMQGQTFKASTAMAKGLIDGVVDSVGEVAALL